jgi:hypothetical protein
MMRGPSICICTVLHQYDTSDADLSLVPRSKINRDALLPGASIIITRYDMNQIKIGS